jgi:hypothetical protein
MDVGFDPDRGYAATVMDVQEGKMKGIRGNSIEQLTSRIRRVLIDEASKKRHFPLESETSRIITPNGFE